MSPSRSYHKQHNVLHSISSDLFPSRYQTFHGKETSNLSIGQIRSTVLGKQDLTTKLARFCFVYWTSYREVKRSSLDEVESNRLVNYRVCVCVCTCIRVVCARVCVYSIIRTCPRHAQGWQEWGQVWGYRGWWRWGSLRGRWETARGRTRGGRHHPHTALAPPNPFYVIWNRESTFSIISIRIRATPPPPLSLFLLVTKRMSTRANKNRHLDIYIYMYISKPCIYLPSSFFLLHEFEYTM